jgi:nucleotide-binding universal stress UspA family protein
VEEVVRAVQDFRCDLVVTVEAGIETQRLLRRSPCSLLVLPRETAAPHGAILALVDFSPASLEAARWACEVGRMEAQRVELLHFFEIPWKSAKEKRPEAKRAMMEFVGRLGPREGSVISRVELAAIGGYVTLSILSELRHHSYSQVFMGARRRSDLSVFLLGSVAERVVLAATIPVWVIRGAPPDPAAPGKGPP